MASTNLRTQHFKTYFFRLEWYCETIHLLHNFICFDLTPSSQHTRTPRLSVVILSAEATEGRPPKIIRSSNLVQGGEPTYDVSPSAPAEREMKWTKGVLFTIFRVPKKMLLLKPFTAITRVSVPHRESIRCARAGPGADVLLFFITLEPRVE